jgi:phosphatidylinositol-3-phosphatase
MRTLAILLGFSSAVLSFGLAACGSGSSSTSDAGSSSSSGASSGGSGSGSGSSSGGSSGSSSGGSSGSSSGSSSGGSSGSSSGSSGSGGGALQTVFLILMENHNWTDIHGSSSAPYINSLLTNADASWCTNYFDNPAAQHPSEPNYIWLEAGTNALADHTFSTDDDPSASNSSSAPHLGSLMAAKGVTFKDYAEDMPAGMCPITSMGNYAPKHVPFVFFTDIVGSPPSATNATCMKHVVPYTSLQGDLSGGTVAQYNFISPNLCDDMHTDCGSGDTIKQGDDWLSAQLPIIMGSSAYKNNGAIFITWDESEGGEVPIGMIVLSPKAKGAGYQSTTKYYHSSMVRTVEEIFSLTPLLNDAANQPDLSDLFKSFP